MLGNRRGLLKSTKGSSGFWIRAPFRTNGGAPLNQMSSPLDMDTTPNTEPPKPQTISKIAGTFSFTKTEEVWVICCECVNGQKTAVWMETPSGTVGHPLWHRLQAGLSSG